jgi:hypothetical protein
MTKPLTGIQRNVLTLYEVDNNVVNDDSLLLARYWWAYDKWNPQDDLYTNLKRMTPAESITRARRWLHEYGHIKYSEAAESRREDQYIEKTEEYSQRDIYAEMRTKIDKGDL